MDSQRFDDLTAALARNATRRGAVRLFGPAIAGLAAVVYGDALAATKRRKHHATCRDHKRNRRETDVDCGGGKCRRCAIGKHCLIDNDCDSGTCVNDACVACTPTLLCGSDANGNCRCDRSVPSGEPVCDSAPELGLSVDDCAKCPAGTDTCVAVGGLFFNCYHRCGSRA